MELFLIFFSLVGWRRCQYWASGSVGGAVWGWPRTRPPGLNPRVQRQILSLVLCKTATVISSAWKVLKQHLWHRARLRERRRWRFVCWRFWRILISCVRWHASGLSLLKSNQTKRLQVTYLEKSSWEYLALELSDTENISSYCETALVTQSKTTERRRWRIVCWRFWKDC